VIFTKVILAQQLLVKTSYPDLTFGKDLIPWFLLCLDKQISHWY
jgi:hypothetical protein